MDIIGVCIFCRRVFFFFLVAFIRFPFWPPKHKWMTCVKCSHKRKTIKITNTGTPHTPRISLRFSWINLMISSDEYECVYAFDRMMGRRLLVRWWWFLFFGENEEEKKFIWNPSWIVITSMYLGVFAFGQSRQHNFFSLNSDSDTHTYDVSSEPSTKNTREFSYFRFWTVDRSTLTSTSRNRILYARTPLTLSHSHSLTIYSIDIFVPIKFVTRMRREQIKMTWSISIIVCWWWICVCVWGCGLNLQRNTCTICRRFPRKK